MPEGTDDAELILRSHRERAPFGTLAAGVFNAAGFSWHQVGVQALGVGAAFAWAFGAGLVVFKLIDVVIGMRVSQEEELAGLDFGEHGASAYPDFQTVHVGSVSPGEGGESPELAPVVRGAGVRAGQAI